MAISRIALLRRAKAWPWFIFSVLFIVAIVLLFRQQNKINRITAETDNTIDALTDTIRVYRMEDGSQKATITAFKTSNLKQFRKLQSSDSTIKRLQQLVTKYGTSIGQGSAAVFTASTTVNNTSKTTIYSRDTVTIDKISYIYPEYRSSFALGKWVQGVTVANKDSTTVAVRTYNEYDVVVGDGSRGWFKKSKPFADVITHSPYDSISRLRALNVSVPRQKRLGLGFHIGYGYPLAAKPQGSILIGVGVNYNVIQIK